MMKYRPFRRTEAAPPPATVATAATVLAPHRELSQKSQLSHGAVLTPSTGWPSSVENVATVTAIKSASVFADRANRLDGDWLSAFDERAAILEFDGGHDRAEAQRLAFSETVLALGPRPEN